MRGGITSHFGSIIWKLPIPEKHKLFNWLCFHNKLLTPKILAKKGLVGRVDAHYAMIMRKMLNTSSLIVVIVVDIVSMILGMSLDMWLFGNNDKFFID